MQDKATSTGTAPGPRAPYTPPTLHDHGEFSVVTGSLFCGPIQNGCTGLLDTITKDHA